MKNFITSAWSKNSKEITNSCINSLFVIIIIQCIRVFYFKVLDGIHLYDAYPRFLKWIEPSCRFGLVLGTFHRVMYNLTLPQMMPFYFLFFMVLSLIYTHISKKEWHYLIFRNFLFVMHILFIVFYIFSWLLPPMIVD